MMLKVIDGIKVDAQEGINDGEINAIVADELVIWRNKGKVLGEVSISVDGEELVIKSFERSPIKRVRRITGYLSTAERFNAAKQAELGDRIKHL
jgi:anaerobic ribonucleoside-triphosphate reductase activating protein